MKDEYKTNAHGVVSALDIKERRAQQHEEWVLSKYWHMDEEICLFLIKTRSKHFYALNKERQCMYNVTLRRVRAPLLQWTIKKYYVFWACVCTLTYAACNAVACPALQYFLPYLINGANYEKKLLNIKCVFWFSLQLLCETFLIQKKKKKQRYDQKCKLVCM